MYAEMMEFKLIEPCISLLLLLGYEKDLHYVVNGGESTTTMTGTARRQWVQYASLSVDIAVVDLHQ